MLGNLANLDCELMTLGTKIYAAKEKLAADIRYEMKKSSSNDEDEKETKSSDKNVEENVKTTEEEYVEGCSYFELLRRKSEKIFADNRVRIEKEEADRKRKAEEEAKAEASEEKKINIKDCVDTFEDLLTRISESEGGDVMVDTLLKDMSEISEDLKTFLNKPKDEKDKLLQQMQASSLQKTSTSVPEQQNVGMNYSGLVNGVNYTAPEQAPTQPTASPRQVTVEDVDAALLAQQMNQNQIPVDQQPAVEKKSKK